MPRYRIIIETDKVFSQEDLDTLQHEVFELIDDEFIDYGNTLGVGVVYD